VGKLNAAGKSLREIGAVLDAKGFKARNGGEWHPNSIRGIAAQSPVPAGRPRHQQR